MNIQNHTPIPVLEAKKISDQYNKSIVIIAAWDPNSGLLHVTTYGVSENEKVEAALGGEIVSRALGASFSNHYYEDFRKEKRAQFTLSELKTIAMDYQALLSTNKIMGMSIQGDGELAQSMVDQEVVRQQIFEKVKDKVPVSKKDLLSIKPINSLKEDK